MPKKLKDESAEVEPVAEDASASKPAKHVAALVAYADFEFDGKAYKAGDPFVPAKDLSLSEELSAFRNVDRQRGAVAGLAFIRLGEIIDRKTDERAVRTIVLPVKSKE